jgi:hypothetical protein
MVSALLIEISNSEEYPPQKMPTFFITFFDKFSADVFFLNNCKVKVILISGLKKH